MDVDIDNDFDGELLNQFRSMGTTDRDVLIAEFQAVLGNTLNPESCAFFLDMNDWNLQNAVCSYYDLQQPASALPSMKVLADVTVGNGEAVAPNTIFFKTWQIKNSGTESWPPGCHLSYCSGDNMSDCSAERKMVAALSPGESAEVSVKMRSPSAPGTYHCMWRILTPTGILFGEVIQWSIVVAEGGLLGITQQLASINGGVATSLPDSMDSSTQQQPNQQQVVLYPLQTSIQLQNTSNPATGAAPSLEEDTEMS